MIICRTPYRLSFFGGGTDFPVWYREHGGAVLTATINRYCYLTCRFLPPFFTHKSRIVWSEIERVTDHNAIRHPVVRVILDLLKVDQGVEIHHDGDLPARSGLGSSSAFTVGLLHALHALQGHTVSKMDLARQAIHVEQEILHENVGVQDQIQTAHGGLNRIEFLPHDDFRVQPVGLPVLRERELEDHLLLFYTGVARHSSDIAAAQVANLKSKSTELRRMREMVDEGIAILQGNGDINDFGHLLHEAWNLKRGLSDKIAPGFIQDIYERARKAGALGGKVLGAGGGGFMVFFVRPADHPKVLSALGELLVVPTEFEHLGTQIIFHDQPRYSRTVLSGTTFRHYGADGEGPNGDSL